MGLTAGDSKSLKDMTHAIVELSKMAKRFNENFVEFATTLVNQNERIITELEKANVPFDEDEVEHKTQVIREMTDAARDLAEVTNNIPTEPKWNIGDQARVLAKNSGFFGEIGTIIGRSMFDVTLEFAETAFSHGSGGLVNKRAAFSPLNLHHMEAHLKPAALGPEWKVGAGVLVIDKFTFMYGRVGRITAVSPTLVDVRFDMSGGEFHPSQLEIVDGGALVTDKVDFEFKPLPSGEDTMIATAVDPDRDELTEEEDDSFGAGREGRNEVHIDEPFKSDTIQTLGMIETFIDRHDDTRD